MDAQCDKLAMAVGHQFITPSVHRCVHHHGREAERGAGLSAAACQLFRNGQCCDIVYKLLVDYYGSNLINSLKSA